MLHVRVDGGGGVLLAPAQGGQRIQHLRLPHDTLTQRQLVGLAVAQNQLAGKLQHDAAGTLRADARNLREGLVVTGGHGSLHLRGGVHAQHRQGDARADARDREHHVKDLAFGRFREAVEGHGFLAHDHGGQHGGLLPRAQLRESACGGVHQHAETINVNHRVVKPHLGHAAGQRCNHSLHLSTPHAGANDTALPRGLLCRRRASGPVGMPREDTISILEYFF